MMSTKLEWTQKLGDAVLAQQVDVMDAIQRLRSRADASEKLKTTKQQKVTKSSAGIVYQRDLGPKTTSIAASITTFNPDHTWRKVLAQDLTN